MSDSILTEDNRPTPEKESEATVKTNQDAPADQTDASKDLSTPDSYPTPLFGKLQVQSDSESSGDEVTAFDRVRDDSDSDEADEKKTLEVAPAAGEKSLEPKQSEETSAEYKLDETVTNSDVTEEVFKLESPTNPDDTTSIPDSDDKPNKETAVEEAGTQGCKEEREVHQQTEQKGRPKSPEVYTSQNKEYAYEREKGKKYPHGKDAYGEKSNRWKHNQEDSFRYANRRERGRGRSNREERGARRDNFTSYGHDDRFYVSQDTRANDNEVEPAVFQGQSPPRVWKGARGRGEEGKWKHDKFYEDEQRAISMEPTNDSYSSYPPPHSVVGGQSQYPEKKGRGRGNKKQQYNDAPAPVPGFSRNSPRQERRGRGSKPYREEPDVFYANSRSSRGRGINRYNDSYRDNNTGVYLSKPIVFVSQNTKNEPPPDRQKPENARSILSSSEVKSSGYTQSSSSTSLPTIPVLSSKPDIDSKDSKRTPQMKYDLYNNKTTNSAPNSSYVGLGRGKGKITHPVSLLQRGQEYKRPTEPVNYDYEKDVAKKDPIEPLHLTSDSSPTFPYSKPHHKPERYSTQRMKQQAQLAVKTGTTTNETTPGLNVVSPINNPPLNSSKEKPPGTHGQGYDASMSPGANPQHETRSSMLGVQYSEFYPSPYKEEMVGAQMSPMHVYNMMPEYMMGPDVLKEGDFQHMQFPPFIPQEMSMNMKGPPNMMGGIPFMGSPQLGPEYMMANEVPPNLQSDLFVPMQSYYPPI